MRKGTVWLVILVVLLLVSCYEDRTFDLPIVSLERDSELHGKQFFLGGGYVDQERYYFTYAVMPDGGFRMVKVKASVTTIYETDSVSPHIWLNRKADHKISVDSLIKYSDQATDCHLWVPIGTIIKEFKL